MLSVRAARHWLNSPRAVEALRLRRVPLLATALCFAGGDVLALRWHHPALLCLCFLLLLLLVVLARIFSPRAASLPVFGLWIVTGCWCAQIAPPLDPQTPVTAFADGLSREVRGRVVRIRDLPATKPDASVPGMNLRPWELEPGAWEADAAPERQSIDLELESIEFLTPDIDRMDTVHGGARITLSGAPLALRCGDTVALPARLRTPDIYRDPGAFSWQGYLLAQGVSVQATAKSSRVRVTGAAGSDWRCRLSRAQAWAAARFEKLGATRLPAVLRLSSGDIAMLDAMLFGDRARLTHTLRDAFERTGTFHLFVVSGLHVGLLAAGLVWIFTRLRFPPWATALLVIVLTTAYTLLTGFGVPAQRALLMVSIYLIAKWLDRETTALNILGAAAIAVLAMSPRALFESSFQMTFFVILAIAGLATPVVERLCKPHLRAAQTLHIHAIDATLQPRLAQFRVRLRMLCGLSEDCLGRRFRYLPRWFLVAALRIAEICLVGLIAELCMALPMALYFHRATLVALPLNVLLIPALGAMLALAVLTFATSLVASRLSIVPSALTALALHLLRTLVTVSAHSVLADLRMPDLPPARIAMALGIIALGLFALRVRSRLGFIGALAAVLTLLPAAVFLPFPALLHPGVLEVTAIDVGQGDSLLVVSPQGGTMLVDAGGPVGRSVAQTTGAFDVGEQVVAPYLWSRRLRRLDVLLLTHAHSDHIGGMPAVLRDFRPRELWLSLVPGDAPGLQALLAEADRLHVPVRFLRAGNTFGWSGLEASALAPEAGYKNPGAPTNNDSLVLRLTFGEASVLLEGDAERQSEAAMLANQRVVPVTLLKVGHHGSRTSTNPDFLAAAQPQAALISVGRHNTFGHPRGEVLERLEQAHTRTWRTDRAGAETLLLSSDGRITAAPASPDGP